MSFDTLGSWLDDWDLALQAGTVVDGTRVSYLRCIRQFIAYMNAEHADVIDITKVTRRHIEGWMRHLVSLGRKNATRRVRLLAVRFWVDYLATVRREELVSRDVSDLDMTSHELTVLGKGSPAVRAEL